MKRIPLVVTLCLGLIAGACASERIDFGGVMSPIDRPSATTACDQSGWQIDETVRPEYPRALISFLYLNQTRNDVRELVYSFDINEDGEPKNIRFVDPLEYMDHRALQSAVLAGGEALDQWTFKSVHPDGPVYAVGCRQQFNFGLHLSQN
ncbi:energy transducer TonB [Maricaulaceae bacterium NA33B04]|nr:energy transducer TonB [Maricaulaceae bacterium NA33B04]